VRILLLLLLFVFTLSCSSEPHLTGYKYGGGTDNGKIRTCIEEDIVNNWWNFNSYSSVVDLVIPGYKDLCVLTGRNGILFWNEEEEWGAYQDNWDWYCADSDTMKVVDTETGESYSVQIFGKDYEGCYDIDISVAGMTIRGDMCPCDDPFEE
jgi:hypothetical protein